MTAIRGALITVRDTTEAMLVTLTSYALVALRRADARLKSGARSRPGYGTLEFAGLALLVVAAVIAANTLLKQPITDMLSRVVTQIGNIK
jgi:hypothetical protein